MVMNKLDSTKKATEKCISSDENFFHVEVEPEPPKHLDIDCNDVNSNLAE